MSWFDKVKFVSKETMLEEIEKVKQDERVIYANTIANIEKVNKYKMYELAKKLKEKEEELSKFRVFLEKLPTYYKALYYTENSISIELSRELK